jgi:murein DD-endopeptidase MepM/ murein hydrolase activator NlpD
MSRLLPPQKGKGLKQFKKLLLLLLAVIVASSTIFLGQWQQVKAQDLIALNPGTNPNAWNGGSFPVENFISYTSPFGYRSSPTGGVNVEFHRGLDMAAPEGSYIRNWWGGTVKEVSDNTGCGTSIIMQSGDWQHVYCHMKGRVEVYNGEKYLVDRDGGISIKQGQMIASGTRIGRVGMTGRTTGPHLHWGLKYNSNYVDPGNVLRAMYNAQVPPQGQMTLQAGKQVKIKDY